MSTPMESQIEGFFDDLLAHPRFPAFARQVEAAGYPQWARLLRVIARSEEVRLRLIRSRFFACANEAEDHHVCPECGLVVAGDLPGGCPVCHTPWDQFELFPMEGAQHA